MPWITCERCGSRVEARVIDGRTHLSMMSETIAGCIETRERLKALEAKAEGARVETDPACTALMASAMRQLGQ